MSRNLNGRQQKRIRKELERDYREEKELRKRRRDEKLSHRRRERYKSKLDEIDESLEEEMDDDR